MEWRSVKKFSKKRIFEIIQIGQRNDLLSRLFDIFIVLVIIVNITVMFMETFEEMSQYSPVFRVLETVTVLVFVVEYLLRIWTAGYLYPNLSRGKAVLRFLVSFDGIVDLCTILPFFFLTGFVAFRMLRVVRIFHLFRINAYYDSFNVITSVLYEKRNQIISSVFIILVLMMASSLCMYSAEHEVQPEVFNNAFSGMWWSISTVLTIGYGDIYPVTVLGRILAIIIALLGIGVVAIPTGIISAGFVEEYTQMQRRKKSEDGAGGTVSVHVDDSCLFIGQTVRELEEKYDFSIVVLVREGEVILPTAGSRIKLGDTLVYHDDNVLNIL